MVFLFKVGLRTFEKLNVRLVDDPSRFRDLRPRDARFRICDNKRNPFGSRDRFLPPAEVEVLVEGECFVLHRDWLAIGKMVNDGFSMEGEGFGLMPSPRSVLSSFYESVGILIVIHG